MIIYMSAKRARDMAKRLRKVLCELGIDLKHTECLKVAARLLGFNDWYHFLRHELDAPLSPLDERLSDADFVARDEMQMSVLAAAGLGEVARELLDRANPTGSWARTPLEEPVWETVAGNTRSDWTLDCPDHQNR
jgi:hypothetical protein